MYWYFEPLAQAPRGQARIKADQRRVMRVTARDDVYLQVINWCWQCLPCETVSPIWCLHSCPNLMKVQG